MRFVFLGDRLPGPGSVSMSFELNSLTSDRRREDVPYSGREIPAAPLGVWCLDGVSSATLGIFKSSWSWSVMRNLGAGAGASVRTAASISVLPGQRDQ